MHPRSKPAPAKADGVADLLDEAEGVKKKPRTTPAGVDLDLDGAWNRS